MKISITVEQMCRLVKGTTTLDQSFLLDRIASLEYAEEHDLAVVLGRGSESVFSEVDAAAIKESKAGLILANSELVPGRHFLVVEDPLAAYTQIVQCVRQSAAVAEEAIHPTAHIGPSVQLDTGVHIGPYAVVEAGARIGAYTHIGAHAVVGARAVIGEATTLHASAVIGADCRVGSHGIIHSGAVIGSDGFGFQATKTGMRKIPQIGIVFVGNHVEIGAGCCIDRATFDGTIIEDGVKMDNLIHVAHNVHIGAGTAILAQTGIAGGVKIGRGCQIGGQVAIKDHLTIGDGARIVSKSAVMKNVAAGATVCGQPAYDFRKWKRAQAALSRLVEKREGAATEGLWNKVIRTLGKAER